MKKGLEKVISIVLAAVSLIFVIILLVIMFNAAGAEDMNESVAADMNNGVVQALVIVFSVLFAVLTTFNIVQAFADHDKVNQILLFRTRESATRATISVVKRIAKKAALNVKGLPLKGKPEGKGTKISKVVLTADANGDVTFKADIKCVTDKAEALIEKVRAELVVTFDELLGLSFKAIDLYLINLKNEYKADKAEVNKVLDKFMESRKLETEALKNEDEAKEEAADAADIAADEVVASIETETVADEVEVEAVEVEAKDEE